MLRVNDLPDALTIDQFSSTIVDLNVAFYVAVVDEFHTIGTGFLACRLGTRSEICEFNIHTKCRRGLLCKTNGITPNIYKCIQYAHGFGNAAIRELKNQLNTSYLIAGQTFTGAPNRSRSALLPNRKLSGLGSSNLFPPMRKCVLKKRSLVGLPGAFSVGSGALRVERFRRTCPFSCGTESASADANGFH